MRGGWEKSEAESIPEASAVEAVMLPMVCAKGTREGRESNPVKAQSAALLQASSGWGTGLRHWQYQQNPSYGYAGSPAGAPSVTPQHNFSCFHNLPAKP